MELCEKCVCGQHKEYSAMYCNGCITKARRVIYERKIDNVANKVVEVIWETIAKELGATSGDVSPKMVAKVEAVIMQAVTDYYENNCK